MQEPRTPNPLEQNLAALDEVQPELARRLRLPVDGSHVEVTAEGARYSNHGTWHPLLQDAAALEAAVAGLDGSASPAGVLLFGVGLGEALGPLLSLPGAGPVTAWDRDPWLLRLALSLTDHAAAIRSGALRFALGADILDHCGIPREAVLFHPLLGQVYAHEAHLLDVPPGDRRAALCLGDLFVDDLATALRAEGYTVVPIDARRWSVEELDGSVARIDPELLAAINYTHGLATFCEERGRKLLCWEVDPNIERLYPVGEPTSSTWMFTWRAAHVPLYRTMGFQHVEHVPLATDVEKRRPVELSPSECEQYDAPVAFVGSSLVARASRCRAVFLELYAAWCDEGEAGRGRGERELDLLLDEQRRDYGENRVPALLEERFGPMLQAVRASDFAEDLGALVGEVAAAEKRLRYVAELGSQGIHVWGDEGWGSTEAYGARYRGSAGHHHELARVYSGARINVDVGRLYQSDIVTMRVFDVLACGGFLLAEHNSELEELFDVGVELETYTTLEDLQQKVTRYLAHPDEARAIAERGRQAVLERHTIRQRLERMLGAMGLRAAAVHAGSPS